MSPQTHTESCFLIGKFFRLFAFLVKLLIYLHIKYFKNILIHASGIFLIHIFGEFIFVSFLFQFFDHGCPPDRIKRKIVQAQVLGIHSLENQSFHITGFLSMRKMGLEFFSTILIFSFFHAYFSICRVRGRTILRMKWSLGGRYECFPVTFPFVHRHIPPVGSLYSGIFEQTF